jgi:beta-phosphoglucomutase
MEAITSPVTRRAVIFDMDGVLTDSEPLINAAAIAMFREKGLLVQPEDFLPFVGTGEDRYIGGVAEKHHFALDLPAAKRRTYEIYLDLVPGRLEPFPGAAELVRDCRRQGLQIAVASSADRIKVVANLQKIGLPIDTWDAVITGETVTSKKPAPDIFLAAASALGRAPSECVVVEDAVNGITAAKAAGMRCVAVAQTFPPEGLAAADLVRARISEISLVDLVGGEAPQTVGISRPLWATGPAGETGSSQPRKAGPWGFWPTLGLSAAVAVAYISAQSVVAMVWAAITAVRHHGNLPKGWESTGFLLSIATCASAPVAIGFTWLFAWLRRTMPVAEYLGYAGFSLKAGAAWTVGMIGLVAVSDWLTLHLGRPLVPEFMQNAYRTAGFMPLLWMALIVAAPITEETLFRGFLFRGILHSRLGPPGAVFLSSMIWAGIHVQYDAYGIVTVFACGLVLGFARLQTGSVYLTIFLHFLMNLIATFETVWIFRSSSG